MGTPQGGVISPLLANIFLHEVVDRWFEKDVKPRLLGSGHLYRYADDIIIILSNDQDAHRLMNVLPKRLGKYGLSLHPDKTKVVNFVPQEKGNSFSLLGFTHYWDKSRRGYSVVKRKPDKNRFSAALQRMGKWCRENRAKTIPQQHKILSAKLRGYYSYYGITGNSFGLARYYCEVRRIWKKWLSRRSWKTSETWDNFKRIIQRFPLPRPIAIHSTYRRVANI